MQFGWCSPLYERGDETEIHEEKIRPVETRDCFTEFLQFTFLHTLSKLENSLLNEKTVILKV